MPKKLLWRIVVAFWLSLVVSVLVIELVEHNGILRGVNGMSDAQVLVAVILRLLIVFVISGSLIFVATRSVTKPLRWVSSAAQKLGSGELAVRINGHTAQVGAATEIEDLIQDFNRMAERVEQLVQSQHQLLSDVSHELRSPLARLSLAAELLRECPLEEREEHLARFDKEINKLNDLIGRLLTLSRLESSTLAIQRDFFDIADITAEAIADVRIEASARGCSVECVKSEQCPVIGDQSLLRSAIENVLRNAVYYTHEGTSVYVTVACQETQVTISVQDHGPGMSEKELQQIFRPFYRTEEARARRTDGHGLGLAIAYRAIDLHDGSIQAENAGGGLRVTIAVPTHSSSTIAPGNES